MHLQMHFENLFFVNSFAQNAFEMHSDAYMHLGLRKTDKCCALDLPKDSRKCMWASQKTQKNA